MKAYDRNIQSWFELINSGRIRLPRFQRFEAWGHSEVTSLLEAVLSGLPSGATLILQVGDQELFSSRVMHGAPTTEERVIEHLLDGQQRLTALWRSLNGLYDEKTYFARLPIDGDDESEEFPLVYAQTRWMRNGQLYPLWADDPGSAYEKMPGYFHLSLLRPGDISREIRTWCRAATSDPDVQERLEDGIRAMREKLIMYNIPYLSLPPETPRHVALDVFIKLNTSSVRLTDYDIVVAQFEAETEQSLHQLVENLQGEVPSLAEYVEPGDLVLSVAALREDRTPTRANYLRIDLERMAEEWNEIVAGIKFAVESLEQEKIFDASRLPTVAVIPVIAALNEFVPEAGDARGNAKVLIRKYLWRAFMTRRYENSASSRSLQDYRGLRSLLLNESAPAELPVFNENLYALPQTDELLRAGWPKKKDILARGLLNLSIRLGARDIADNEIATRLHLKKREYHHLFPDALLTQDGSVSESESFRALNCALLTWNTNRSVGAKEPIEYLKSRTQASNLGENEIRNRLQSHLVPFDSLNVGGYAGITDPSEKSARIRTDYESFLRMRAEMMLEPIRALCDGRDWTRA